MLRPAEMGEADHARTRSALRSGAPRLAGPSEPRDEVSPRRNACDRASLMRNALTKEGLDLGDSLRRMLSAMPLRNAQATVRRDGPEELRITVRLERSLFPPPLSWVVPSPKTRTVRLDRLGAQVWDLCDGRRTVEAVVEEFARAHELTFHEARVAVAEYLRQLLRRGALAIAMESGGTLGTGGEHPG